MLVKVMGIEMSNEDYMCVNAEIIKMYGKSWNKYKYSDKIKIIEDILPYV